jgi:hypothetical protein
MESNEILKKILLHMKYDSKKTLSENKIILNEAGPTPLTFNGPSTQNLSQIVKYTTVGKILSKVSNNLSELKKIVIQDGVVSDGGKYLWYDEEGSLVKKYKPSIMNCVSETYSNGRVKSWDMACRTKHFQNLDKLMKERHTFCLSRILNNQSLLNLPFAIQVGGTKMDEFGDSDDGTYKILFFLTGEDCKYNGFNYYLDSGYETTLNWDYKLKPLKVELISKPKEQPKPIVKKVEQKSETPKLTLDQQKKWCADHGKVWNEDTNTCQFAEVTVKSSETAIRPKEDKKINNLMPGIGSDIKGMGDFSFDLEL